jgi:hypothetical protein
MCSLSEIVFRLFAWLRPVLWYYHRLGTLVAAMLFAIEDEASLLWLEDYPEARADFEAKVADGEHCLEIAVALRARELLGWPIRPEDRPGISRRARIHCAPSLARLTARVLRLAHRHSEIERLARLRSARLRREIEAAPVRLIADHRPQPDAAGLWWWWWWWWWFSPRTASPARARLRRSRPGCASAHRPDAAPS